MRQKIMAGVAAAAVVAGGTLAVTESPAEAHGECRIIHLSIDSVPALNLIHLCI